MSRRSLVMQLLGVILMGCGIAEAQTVSVRWQLAPFCNVVAVTLTPVAAGQFTMVGSDDRCGELAGTVPVDLAGSCQSGADGQVHCAWDAQAPTIPYGPAATGHFSAVVSLTTGQGVWSTDKGARGEMRSLRENVDAAAGPPMPLSDLPDTELVETAAITAIGVDALVSNTTGTSNTAVGVQALRLNTGGGSNTAIGAEALMANTSGDGNTATGRDALRMNTASFNTATGALALSNNTTGTSNTAVGKSALQDNSTGDSNTAVGRDALLRNTANGNTATGAFALAANTTGFRNTAVGRDALVSNTSGHNNTAVGYRALMANIDGDYNTSLGVHALNQNVGGRGNTAVGLSASSNNQTGNYNTATGFEALFWNTASENTATGTQALYKNTRGVWNTAVGVSALRENTTGFANTAVGQDALLANAGDTANANTATGFQALQQLDAGAINTAIGAHALGNMTSGDENIALGYRAGVNTTKGTNNIYIGHPGVSGESNRIRIGDADQVVTFIAGIRNKTTGVANGIPVLIDSAGQLGTISSSRRVKDNITDMGATSHPLLRLRPVTFRYTQASTDGTRPIQYGLIAEEVAEVLPELVAFDRDGQPETVYYHLLPAMLLNEMQKQQRTIEAQKERLRVQADEIADLVSRLRELETLMKSPRE